MIGRVFKERFTVELLGRFWMKRCQRRLLPAIGRRSQQNSEFGSKVEPLLATNYMFADGSWTDRKDTLEPKRPSLLIRETNEHTRGEHSWRREAAKLFDTQ